MFILPRPRRGCEQGVGWDENTINLFIIDSTEKSTFKHRVESKHPLKRATLVDGGEVSRSFKGESAVTKENSERARRRLASWKQCIKVLQALHNSSKFAKANISLVIRVAQAENVNRKGGENGGGKAERRAAHGIISDLCHRRRPLTRLRRAQGSRIVESERPPAPHFRTSRVEFNASVYVCSPFFIHPSRHTKIVTKCTRRWYVVGLSWQA